MEKKYVKHCLAVVNWFGTTVNTKFTMVHYYLASCKTNKLTLKRINDHVVWINRYKFSCQA